jgi:hypothetical protein
LPVTLNGIVWIGQFAGMPTGICSKRGAGASDEAHMIAS